MRFDKDKLDVWRKAVYKKHNWTCANCNKKRRKCHAHHIKPKGKYPELAYDIDNGICWCEKCHNDYHKGIQDQRKCKRPRIRIDWTTWESLSEDEKQARARKIENQTYKQQVYWRL